MSVVLLALCLLNDVTLEEHKVNLYDKQSGWTISLDFPGSDLVHAAFTGGDLGQAALGSLPGGSALEQLINTRKTQDLEANGAQAGLTGFNDLATAAATYNQTGSGLAALGSVSGVGSGGAGGGPSVAVTLSAETYSDETKWTQSDVSQINANNIVINAQHDANLNGGTQSVAQNDLTVSAGNNINIAANADTFSQKSQSEGASVGVSVGASGGEGISVSGNYAQAKAKGTTFENALLQAGNDLTLTSGKDTNINGGNLLGNQVNLNVGGNLTVASLQDTSSSSSIGGSLGLSYSGAMITPSVSFQESNASSAWTDHATTIEGKDGVTINVNKNTNLIGSQISADNGNLTLNTGSISYSDLHDYNKSSSFGFSVSDSFGSSGSTGGSIGLNMSNSDKEGMIKATIGAGQITTIQNTNLSNLNRDLANAQQITKDTGSTVNLLIPIINPQVAANQADMIQKAVAALDPANDPPQATELVSSKKSSPSGDHGNGPSDNTSSAGQGNGSGTSDTSTEGSSSAGTNSDNGSSTGQGNGSSGNTTASDGTTTAGNGTGSTPTGSQINDALQQVLQSSDVTLTPDQVQSLETTLQKGGAFRVSTVAADGSTTTIAGYADTQGNATLAYQEQAPTGTPTNPSYKIQTEISTLATGQNAYNALLASNPTPITISEVNLGNAAPGNQPPVINQGSITVNAPVPNVPTENLNANDNLPTITAPTLTASLPATPSPLDTAQNIGSGVAVGLSQGVLTFDDMLANLGLETAQGVTSLASTGAGMVESGTFTLQGDQNLNGLSSGLSSYYSPFQQNGFYPNDPLLVGTRNAAGTAVSSVMAGKSIYTVAKTLPKVVTSIKTWYQAGEKTLTQLEKVRKARLTSSGSINLPNPGNPVRTIIIAPVQLQSKFKHAADFGIVGNFNATNAIKFQDAISQFINSPGIQVIQGSYRGTPVTFYLNSGTSLNVIVDQSGNFVSAWKLSAQQLQYVLTTGKLGGGN